MSSGPVLHHLARGIHPAAFVGATPPFNWRAAWDGAADYALTDAVSHAGTAYLCILAHSNHEPPNATYWAVLDIQDHVFWVDTSGSPPFPLNMWDAASGAWVRVTTPNVIVADDPPDPATTPDGTIWVDSNQHGAVTPQQTSTYPAFIVYDGNGRWFPLAANVVIRPDPPSDPILNQFWIQCSDDYWTSGIQSDAFPLRCFTGTTATTDACTVAGWLDVGRELPAPRPDVAVLVADADGLRWLTSDWDGGNLIYFDGTRFQVLARGISGNYLSVNPDLEPQWADLPPVVLPTIPVPPTTVPAGADVQVRCGVATAMTDHLASLYSQWAKWLAAALAVVGAAASTVLVAFLDAFFAPLSPEITAVWIELQPAVAALTTAFLATALPSLTPDQTTALIHGIFCPLTVTSGTCVPTAANITAWQSAIEASGGPWANDLQRDLLNALLQFTPLNDWLVAAASSTQSSACDGMTCP